MTLTAPPSVLFLVKDKTPGYGGVSQSSGLANAARMTAAALAERGLDAAVATANDANDVDRLVTAADPTHVVVEALWVTPAKMAELLAIPRHAARQWYVRVHSKAPFIAQEGVATAWLAAYAQLGAAGLPLVVAANSRAYAEDLALLLKTEAAHLPNVYVPTEVSNSGPAARSPFLDVGCFGAMRPLKNQYEQAIAALKVARDLGRRLKFHVNRPDEASNPVLANLQALFAAQGGEHFLQLHDWLPHRQFLDLVRRTDIGMQVSLSESFNIVAADYVSMGVPIVASDEVDWLPENARVAANTTAAIASRLRLELLEHRPDVVARNKTALLRYNFRAMRDWGVALGVES